MIIENPFEKVKNINLILGFKFENIEFFKDGSFIEIFSYHSLFRNKEKEIIKNIMKKNIFFKNVEKFSILPFPVRNSKFNNFVIIYNGKKMIYYQKNKPEKKEVLNISKEEPFFILKGIIRKKLEFLIENYKYIQIVFPWIKEDEMIKYYSLWNNFREKENIKKFVGNIYFSYFMEVGYEPSS